MDSNVDPLFSPTHQFSEQKILAQWMGSFNSDGINYDNFDMSLFQDFPPVISEGTHTLESIPSPAHASTSVNLNMGTVPAPVDSQSSTQAIDDNLELGTEPTDIWTNNNRGDGQTTIPNSEPTQHSSSSDSATQEYDVFGDPIFYTQSTEATSYVPTTDTPQAGPSVSTEYQIRPPQRASIAGGNGPIMGISKPLMRTQASSQPIPNQQGGTSGTQPTTFPSKRPQIPQAIQQSLSLPQPLPPRFNQNIPLPAPTATSSAPPTVANTPFLPTSAIMQHNGATYPPQSMGMDPHALQSQLLNGWVMTKPMPPVVPSHHGESMTTHVPQASNGGHPPSSSSSTPGAMAMPSTQQLNQTHAMMMQRIPSNRPMFAQLQQAQLDILAQQANQIQPQQAAQPHIPIMRPRRDAHVLSAEKDSKPPTPWDKNPQGRAQQGQPQNLNGQHGVPRLGAGAGYPLSARPPQHPTHGWYIDPNTGKRNQVRLSALNQLAPPVKQEAPSFFDHVHQQNEQAAANRVMMQSMMMPPMAQRTGHMRFVANSTAEDFQNAGGSLRGQKGQKRKREYEGDEGMDAGPSRPKRRKQKAKDIEDDVIDQIPDEQSSVDGDVYIKCSWPAIRYTKDAGGNQMEEVVTCGKMLWVFGPGTKKKSSSIRRHLIKCMYHQDVVYGMSEIACQWGTSCKSMKDMNLDNIDRHITKTTAHIFVPYVRRGYHPQTGPVFEVMSVEEQEEWMRRNERQRKNERAQKELLDAEKRR